MRTKRREPRRRRTWWDLLLLLVAPESAYPTTDRQTDELPGNRIRIARRRAWERRQFWHRLSQDERIDRYLAAVRSKT